MVALRIFLAIIFLIIFLYVVQKYAVRLWNSKDKYVDGIKGDPTEIKQIESPDIKIADNDQQNTKEGKDAICQEKKD